jgi:hypothetical protein
MLILIKCTVSLQYSIDETAVLRGQVKADTDRANATSTVSAAVRQGETEDTQSTTACKE